MNVCFVCEKHSGIGYTINFFKFYSSNQKQTKAGYCTENSENQNNRKKELNIK